MKLGIDIGTSYSSIAAVVDGKLEMIKISTGASAFGDSYSMPTAVYMDNGSVLLGQAAFNKRIVEPSRFKSEFKRDFGTVTPYILGEEECLPEQIYTELFLYFKKQAAEQMDEEIEMAYITHPANYGNNKKLLLKKSAANAGLFNIEFVDEPTAAAIGYSQKNKIDIGDILMVYDLGGGTFDVAIIKKTANGYVHLTEPLGISQCGGMDFDRVIFEDILNKLGNSGKFDIDALLNEKRFIASLAETSIQIKHQLSQAEEHSQPIAVGFNYFDYTITRKEFDKLITPLVTRTCDKVKDIIYNAGLSTGDLDKVLLVGGSSRVPLVREMVGIVTGKKIALDADPEFTICQGAVCSALLQENEAEKKRLEEEENKRRIEEEKTRMQEIQRQLEEEQRRIREEKLRIEEMKRKDEEEKKRTSEQKKKEAENTNSQKTAQLSFRLRGYSDFIKDNKPFTMLGVKLVIRVDDRYEVEIPPNPTRTIELPPGEHQIFIYLVNGVFKQKKTLQKIYLKENEKCLIEIKYPCGSAFTEFKLYCNNKILN